MTFDEALAQLEVTVREHGLSVEDLLARLRAGEISQERFVSELRPLQQAFEKIVEELTREARSSALAAIASLKAPESRQRTDPSVSAHNLVPAGLDRPRHLRIAGPLASGGSPHQCIGWRVRTCRQEPLVGSCTR